MRNVVLLGVLGLTVGCGTAMTPSSPTAPAATAVTFATTISSGRARIALGSTEQLSASIASSSGAVDSAPAGIWSTDSSSVATVSSTGLVTAVTPGDVTISFESASGRALKKLTITGDLTGLWSGKYVTTACVESPDFAAAGFCDTFPSGLNGRFSFQATQADSSVTASWILNSNSFEYGAATAAMSNGSSSAVSISAARTAQPDFQSSTSFQITQTKADAFTGELQITFTRPGMNGTGRIAGRITSTQRTSSAPAFSTFFSPMPVNSFADVRSQLFQAWPSSGF